MSTHITSESTVTLHFTIKLPDGSTAESSRTYKEPAQFKMGDGSLMPALETMLLGLTIGDKKQFKIAPEDGFGMPREGNIQVMSRHSFPVDMTLEEGLIIAFQQPNGTEIPGIIRKIEGDNITVDFNHPLSGLTLTFDVEILDVQ